MRKIIYSFIKTDVERNFDVVGLNVVPQDVFHCFRQIAEEEAFASMIDELSMAFARWLHPNLTTKRSEIAEVGFYAKVQLMRRFGVTFAGEIILNAKMVVKSICPELIVKTGASEKATNGIA